MDYIKNFIPLFITSFVSIITFGLSIYTIYHLVHIPISSLKNEKILQRLNESNIFIFIVIFIINIITTIICVFILYKIETMYAILLAFLTIFLAISIMLFIGVGFFDIIETNVTNNVLLNNEEYKLIKKYDNKRYILIICLFMLLTFLLIPLNIVTKSYSNKINQKQLEYIITNYQTIDGYIYYLNETQDFTSFDTVISHFAQTNIDLYILMQSDFNNKEDIEKLEILNRFIVATPVQKQNIIINLK